MRLAHRCLQIRDSKESRSGLNRNPQALHFRFNSRAECSSSREQSHFLPPLQRSFARSQFVSLQDGPPAMVAIRREMGCKNAKAAYKLLLESKSQPKHSFYAARS